MFAKSSYKAAVAYRPNGKKMYQIMLFQWPVIDFPGPY